MVNLKEIDDFFSKANLLFNEEQIEKGIDKVAHEMNEQLADKNPILLCVMHGAMLFMGHLIPRLTFHLQIDYIHVSRYCGGLRGRDLHWLSEPSTPLENRNIIIIDDVLDAGLTVAAVKDYCFQKKAKKIYAAVLIDKDRPRDKGGLEKANFTGLYCANKFLLGYGFDYQGYLRNKPAVYTIEESLLHDQSS